MLVASQSSLPASVLSLNGLAGYMNLFKWVGDCKSSNNLTRKCGQANEKWVNANKWFQEPIIYFNIFSGIQSLNPPLIARLVLCTSCQYQQVVGSFLSVWVMFSKKYCNHRQTIYGQFFWRENLSWTLHINNIGPSTLPCGTPKNTLNIAIPTNLCQVKRWA